MLISFSSNKFQRDLSGCTGRGGGVLLDFLGGGRVCHTVLQIVTLFETKKFHFSHPFSDLASKKLCHHFLDSTLTKEISYLHIYVSFFLIHLELKR